MVETMTDKIDKIRKEFPLAAQAIEYLQQQIFLSDGQWCNFEASRFQASRRDLSNLDKAIKKFGSKTLGDLFDQPLDPPHTDYPLSSLTAWKEFVYSTPAWDEYRFGTAASKTDTDIAAKVGRIGLVACQFLGQIAYNA